MTVTLSTTLRNIGTISNGVNINILEDFYRYLKDIGTSEGYQNQNIKQITNLARYLGTKKTFYDLSKNEIITFLDTKIKSNAVDPDKKWITTWNDYLWRIKYFFRWLHNYKLVKERGEGPADVYDCDRKISLQSPK